MAVLPGISVHASMLCQNVDLNREDTKGTGKADGGCRGPVHTDQNWILENWLLEKQDYPTRIASRRDPGRPSDDDPSSDDDSDYKERNVASGKDLKEKEKKIKKWAIETKCPDKEDGGCREPADTEQPMISVKQDYPTRIASRRDHGRRSGYDPSSDDDSDYKERNVASAKDLNENRKKKQTWVIDSKGPSKEDGGCRGPVDTEKPMISVKQDYPTRVASGGDHSRPSDNDPSPEDDSDFKKRNVASRKNLKEKQKKNQKWVIDKKGQGKEDVGFRGPVYTEQPMIYVKQDYPTRIASRRDHGRPSGYHPSSDDDSDYKERNVASAKDQKENRKKNQKWVIDSKSKEDGGCKGPVYTEKPMISVKQDYPTRIASGGDHGRPSDDDPSPDDDSDFKERNVASRKDLKEKQKKNKNWVIDAKGQGKEDGWCREPVDTEQPMKSVKQDYPTRIASGGDHGRPSDDDTSPDDDSDFKEHYVASRKDPKEKQKKNKNWVIDAKGQGKDDGWCREPVDTEQPMKSVKQDYPTRIASGGDHGRPSDDDTSPDDDSDYKERNVAVGKDLKEKEKKFKKWAIDTKGPGKEDRGCRGPVYTKQPMISVKQDYPTCIASGGDHGRPSDDDPSPDDDSDYKERNVASGTKGTDSEDEEYNVPVNKEHFSISVKQENPTRVASRGDPDCPSCDDDWYEDRSNGVTGKDFIRKWVIDQNAWEKCMEQNFQTRALKLLKAGKLPNQTLLDKACLRYKRTDSHVQAICKNICCYIKNKSKSFLDVWAAYYYKKGDTCYGNEVYFVIFTDSSDDIEVTEFKTVKRSILEVASRNENKDIKKKENEDRPSQSEIQGLETCLKENAESLMERHSNLTRVTASWYQSSRFGTDQYLVQRMPCIALYVHIKGYIPLDEEPFKSEVGKYPVDVREGISILCGKPNEYHEHVKMGCTITGQRQSLTGTLGAFFELKGDNTQYAITSAHVLITGNSLEELIEKGNINCCGKNEYVYQPPFVHDNNRLGDVNGAIYSQGQNGDPGMEFAVININPERQPDTGTFPDDDSNLSNTEFGPGNPFEYYNGQCFSHELLSLTGTVYKYGSETKLTKGVCRFIGASVRARTMVAKQCPLVLHKQIEIEPVDNIPFGDNGDSGALVLTYHKNELKAIGIFEGKSDSDVYFVTPLYPILVEIERRTGKECNLKQFKTIKENIVYHRPVCNAGIYQRQVRKSTKKISNRIIYQRKQMFVFKQMLHVFKKELLRGIKELLNDTRPSRLAQ